MAGQVEVTDLTSLAASGLTSNAQIITYEQTGDATRTLFMDAVSEANSQNGCACVNEFKLTIATADVLTLNATPIELIAAPGAGFAIEVFSASVKIVYNTTAYATNTTLQVITSGSVIEQAELDVLAASASTYKTLPKPLAAVLVAIPTAQLIDNAAVNVTVKTGDPTLGDSDITIYGTYRIIQL